MIDKEQQKNDALHDITWMCQKKFNDQLLKTHENPTEDNINKCVLYGLDWTKSIEDVVGHPSHSNLLNLLQKYLSPSSQELEKIKEVYDKYDIVKKIGELDKVLKRTND